jgi:hypothetical protein
MQALRHAATEDKAEIYAGLNLQLTYHPGRRIITTGSNRPDMCERVVSEGVLVPFGARLGLPRFAERVYAGMVASTAAGWLAAATLLGPLTPPLPRVLSIGASVLCQT